MRYMLQASIERNKITNNVDSSYKIINVVIEYNSF